MMAKRDELPERGIRPLLRRGPGSPCDTPAAGSSAEGHTLETWRHCITDRRGQRPVRDPLPDDLKPGIRGRPDYCMRSAIAASRSWPRLVDVVHARSDQDSP